MRRNYLCTESMILCISVGIFLTLTTCSEAKSDKKVFIKDSIERIREVWITDNYGLNPRQLTGDGMDKDNPVLSPDGTKIAYNLGEFVKEKRVVIIDPQGEKIKTLDVSDEAGEKCIDKLEWIDNNKIGIDVHLNPWYGVYQVMDMTTGEVIADFWGSNFAWSPNRSKIAYASPNYVRDAHGSLIRSDALSINDVTIYPTDDDPNEIYPLEADSHKHRFKTNFFWSPDSNYLTFIDEHEDTGKRHLILLKLEHEIAEDKIIVPARTKDFGDDPYDSLKWSEDSKAVALYKGNKKVWAVNVPLRKVNIPQRVILIIVPLTFLILIIFYVSFGRYKRMQIRS